MREAVIRWFLPEAEASQYNDWRIVFDSAVDPTWLWGLAALVAVSVVASFVGTSRLSAFRRALVLSLRVASAAMIVLILLEPALELRAVSPVRTKTLVVLDDSNSMGLVDASGRTRAESLAAHIRDNRSAFDRLQQESSLEVFSFSASMQPLDGLPESLPVRGTATDLGRLLADLQWQAEGQDLGAVLVYSDGTDTTGLTLERARALAEEVGVPIHTVGFADSDAAPDLAVSRVRTDDFAFVHNTVGMEVEVELRSLPLTRVPVTLKRDGAVLQTRDAAFVDGRATVRFEFKPKEVGKEIYSVSVPVQPQEAVKTNNQRSVVIRIIRDRIRVLQVAGRPSWDVRFLRELLKRNPNVDLISFFILRSTTDVQKAAQDELALIPFPVNDLFTTELETFDVVIYQNFSYRPYRMAHYLRNIRDYVIEGGSFLMVGGDQSFEPGFYEGTPIADILPVQLGSMTPWDPAPFVPRLTSDGRLHPITRIGPAGVAPSAIYSRLPKLEGFNGSLGLAPGGRALLEHPSLPGNPPVVAIREVGEGRSMAVATDSLWFWRFLAVEDDSTGREYDRFWSQSLRWLIRDPDLSRVRLQAQRAVVYRGEPIIADVTVLGVDYRGLEGAEVRADLEPLDPGLEGRSMQVRTGPDGLAVLEMADVEPGTYVLRARAFDDGEIGAAEEPFIVEAADVERQAPFPRPALLQAISDASGGSFTTIRERLPDLRVEAASRVEVDRSRVVPIWNGFAVLVILIGLLGAEWWVRRRAGLL